MHNKEYALKLVQDKINCLNNYSYSQISTLTGFSKRQLLNFSKQLEQVLRERDERLKARAKQS